MAKPIIFSSSTAPLPPKAPDPPPPRERDDGMNGAIGQLATAFKTARKSKKPWPKMDDSPLPKISGGAEDA